MLADAIAAKDPFVGGHSEDVATYVGAVGEQLGLEPRRREELVFGSLLHDLGKIGISERILLKPARLSPEERAVIELHPRIGYRLVSRIPRSTPSPPRSCTTTSAGTARGTPRGCAASRSRSRRASSAWPTRSAR
jgi:HD-GYP domain-containing protein (c-di-GMP phosphodiesterase class II)